MIADSDEYNSLDRLYIASAASKYFSSIRNKYWPCFSHLIGSVELKVATQVLHNDLKS